VTRLRLDPQRLLLLVFVGAMFVISAGPLIDTDLWWHLANGRYILAHGVPTADVYSFTAAGQPWVVHEWVTEVGMYVLYQLGGLRALVLGAAALVALGEYLVYRLLRRAGLGVAGAVVLAVVLGLAASPSWGARPQLISFVLTALLLNLLMRYRSSPGRWVWLLGLYFVAWANLHPAFVFGAGLVVLFAVGELLRARARDAGALLPRDRSRLLAVGVVGLLSGLLTPSTVQTYVAFYRVIASPVQRAINVEWASPDFHLVPAGVMLLVLIVVVVAGGAATYRRREGGGADLTEVLLGAVTLALALNSQRNVALFAVAGAPLVGRSLVGMLAATGGRSTRVRAAGAPMTAVNLVLLALLAAGALGLRVLPNTQPSLLDDTTRKNFPVDAVAHLAAASTPSPLFNAYEWGGYLIWSAYPQRKVFIDGRAEVYGDSILSDYIEVAALGGKRQDVLDRYGVQSILIHAGNPLGAVLRSSGWRLEYSDQVAEIYTRA
jgi:hypothetical protein